jgi:hypothetical protein
MRSSSAKKYARWLDADDVVAANSMLTMRRRKSAKGDFWGCSTYPACKGTRPT